MSGWWRTGVRRWLGAALLGPVVAYGATGFYVVDTDEQGVVRRFGAVAGRVGPGMHYRMPWPADRVDIVRTTSVMKTGVGLEVAEGGQVVGMELLTGDTNLLNIALALQYVIRSPADFLFRIEDPAPLSATSPRRCSPRP